MLGPAVDGGYARPTVDGLPNIQALSLTGGRLGWALPNAPRFAWRIQALAATVFRNSFADRRGRRWERSATCSLADPSDLAGAPPGLKEVWYSITYTMQPHCPGVAGE